MGSLLNSFVIYSLPQRIAFVWRAPATGLRLVTPADSVCPWLSESASVEKNLLRRTRMAAQDWGWGGDTAVT